MKLLGQVSSSAAKFECSFPLAGVLKGDFSASSHGRNEKTDLMLPGQTSLSAVSVALQPGLEARGR